MIDDHEIDVEFKWDGMQTEPTVDEFLQAGAETFPDKHRIPRSEWDDRIREHEKHHSSADYFSDRFTEQLDSHECVCHAASQLFLCAYNRQLGGTQNSVWPSPLSLYTRNTNGKQWGGSNVLDSLRELVSNGFLPENDGPEWLGGKGGQQQRFKHTVKQTSGENPRQDWIKPSDLPDGWQDTARHFRVLEWYTIPDAEAFASAILNGWGVSNGRQGHSIPHLSIVKDGKNYLSRYKDSYNVFRFDSERLWNNGGFCIRSVTMPDDPTKPAGGDMK